MEYAKVDDASADCIKAEEHVAVRKEDSAVTREVCLQRWLDLY
jgi:hypothetical protein